MEDNKQKALWITHARVNFMHAFFNQSISRVIFSFLHANYFIRMNPEQPEAFSRGRI